MGFRKGETKMKPKKGFRNKKRFHFLTPSKALNCGIPCMYLREMKPFLKLLLEFYFFLPLWGAKRPF
jgi:hypothetical protein